MATKRKTASKQRGPTYDSLKREIRNRYNNKKQKLKMTSLGKDGFIEIVKQVFADFRVENDKWYRSMITDFGSKGGAKNAENTRGKKKREKETQAEFEM